MVPIRFAGSGISMYREPFISEVRLRGNSLSGEVIAIIPTPTIPAAIATPHGTTFLGKVQPTTLGAAISTCSHLSPFAKYTMHHTQCTNDTG